MPTRRQLSSLVGVVSVILWLGPAGCPSPA